MNQHTHRRTPWLAAATTLLLAFSLLPLALRSEARVMNERAVLLDRPGIARANTSGVAVPAPGEYGVWLWGRRGSELAVSLGEQRFSGTVPAGSGDHGWVRAGAVQLFGGPIRVSPGPGDSGRIGYFALATDPNFNAEAALALHRFRSNTDAAIGDPRAGRARDNQTGIGFKPYTDKEAWLQRRQEIREQILTSTGLWPLPPRTPLRAQVYGELERDGYTIQKVVLETFPGFYLTGNLYRPLGKKGPLPAVLSPHGHWGSGRFDPQVQARGVGLARLGAIVFNYDMVGYGDSKPLRHTFQDDKATLLGMNLPGLQLWNSIRALDFIESLPDVDPKRIACTGASGGGTQTFLLTAVDDRIAVSAPVNMVSHWFQGGCECENSPGLRIDTDNVEIAACFAPKPMLLVGATGDWTKEIKEKGFPEIQATYRLMGAPNNVETVVYDFPHNYNQTSREAVYRFFAKHLLNIDPATAKEAASKPEPVETVSVWDAEHPVPSTALNREQLRDSLQGIINDQLEVMRPREGAIWRQDSDRIVVGLRHSLGVDVPATAAVKAELGASLQGEDFTAQSLLLRYRDAVVPAVVYRPARVAVTGGVLIVHPEGKGTLANGDEPSSLVASLLRRGRVVVGIDPFLTGEQLGVFGTPSRASASMFTTYNRTTLAERVQDILTGLTYLRGVEGVGSVDLVGMDAAGPWCLMASAVSPDVRRTVADAMAFEYTADLPAASPMFQPNALRYGGMKGFGAVAAPGLFIHRTGTAVDTTWMEAAATVQRREFNSRADIASEAEIIDWLTRR